MKKVYLLSLLFVCLSLRDAIAQEVTSVFTLKPTGLEVVSDINSNYIVLAFDGKTKEELYKAALVYLNRAYNSAKDVMSNVENESITINGFAPKAVRRTQLHSFDMKYRLNLEFKDNKVKVDLPSFELTTSDYKHPQVLKLVANNALDGSVLGIWNTKGKLKSEMAKQDVETFFDKHIADMVSAINTQNSDW